MRTYWTHQRLVSALLFIQSYFDIFMDSPATMVINKACKLIQEIPRLLLNQLKLRES